MNWLSPEELLQRPRLIFEASLSPTSEKGGRPEFPPVNSILLWRQHCYHPPEKQNQGQLEAVRPQLRVLPSTGPLWFLEGKDADNRISEPTSKELGLWENSSSLPFFSTTKGPSEKEIDEEARKE